MNSERPRSIDELIEEFVAAQLGYESAKAMADCYRQIEREKLDKLDRAQKGLDDMMLRLKNLARERQRTK